MVKLAARNSMVEYTDEGNHQYRRFRADSMQFNELLILDPCHSAHTSQISKQVYYRLAIITAPEPIETCISLDTERCNATREDQNFKLQVTSTNQMNKSIKK